MKTIFLIVLVNGEVLSWCATSAEAAWEENIDYVTEDIAYITNTHSPCGEED